MKFLTSTLLALVFITVESTPGQESAPDHRARESVEDHLTKAKELAAGGNRRGAIGEFRAAIRLDPSNAPAHWGLAKALDAQSDQTFPLWSGGIMKDTLKEYQRAIELDSNLRDDKTETAELHFQRAGDSLGTDFGHWYSRWCGDFSDNWVNHCMDTAVAEYRIALLLDPNYVPAHLMLGVVLAKLHKTDGAIEEFRAALRIDPQSAEAHLGLGKSLEKKGNLKDALQEYSSADSLAEGQAKYQKLSEKMGIKKAPGASTLPVATAAENPGQAAGPQSPANKSDVRLRVKKGRRYGYADNTGQLPIPLQYDSAGRFSQGLAPVTLGAKWRGDTLLGGKDGYIDTTGKLVIPARFDIAREFSEGLAVVTVGGKWFGQLHGGGKQGYIDKTGKMVIQPKYNAAKEFSEGLAAVAVGGKWANDLLVDEKWGYIDKTGNMVIPPQYEYDDQMKFSDGVARVTVGGKTHYIDKTGQYILEHYSIDGSFSEGLAAVTVLKQTGYVDKTGKMVIPPQYDHGERFSEGLAAVEVGKKYGYIDKTGAMVVPAEYEQGEKFSDGLAAVKVGKKFGYIDKTGTMVIPPSYDDAAPFDKGLAGIAVGGKWGFIDETGKLLVPPQFDDVETSS